MRIYGNKRVCFFYKRNRYCRRGTLIKATCKRTQQLPTLLLQQCLVLLRPCCSNVQTDATTPNNMQQGVKTDATCNIQRWLSPVPTDATFLANNSDHYWMLHVSSVCTPGCMLGVDVQSLKPVKLFATYKRTQQLPILSAVDYYGCCFIMSLHQ